MNDNAVKQENPIILKSNRLKVEIAQPGTVYKGSRFDWTGFITQITLDQHHTYCVPEQYDPNKGSGGIGFCNEFGIDMAIGYEDSKVGECFPKLGVGLLKRFSDAPYDFFKPYEIKPYMIKVSENKNSATFIAEPQECRGYAVRLTKTVRIEENHLKIDYKLENVGEKTIVTNEYCHNFIGINKDNIGKNYSLNFSGKVKINRIAGSFTAAEGEILWEQEPKEDFYGIIEREAGAGLWQWELVHKPSGAGVRDVSGFPVSKCAVWGYTHVVSPELFIRIQLEPGKTLEWSRAYEFFC
ncbi:MAG: hypothetical protein N2484_00790 [Clostridia bacterium]|nr:hypothetical protein [Clostridia bacterium]